MESFIETRNYVDKSTLQNLYYTFVYPYLIYCVEVWGNSCSTYLEPLIVKQEQCVRTISFSHVLAHTEPIFQNLNNIFIHTCYNCFEQYIPINNNILRIIKHVMLNI